MLPGQPAVNSAPVPGATARPAPYVTPNEDLDARTGRVNGAPLFAVDQAGVIAHMRRVNQHVERRLELAARTGRNPDGMLHFGAALHAVEDLFAHSNWVEIAINQLLAQAPAAPAGGGPAQPFLPELQGEARHVFSYSQEQQVTTDPQGRPVRREVLMTGSFTGTDTQISISSEITKFMSEPLPVPHTDAEIRAEREFTVRMLRTFESSLQDPGFRSGIEAIMREAGVPR